MSELPSARESSGPPPWRSLAAGALAVAVAGAVAACSVKNPDFCCSTLDSCGQVGVGEIIGCSDPARPFCDDDGLYGPARACAADPGTTACDGPDDCPTAGLPRCDADGSGTCVGCAGADDCARFAATPLCDDTSGACVACRTSADCDAAAPVCGADQTCRPCAADGECASGLCALGGSCPATDRIVYVDAAAPAGNLACTQVAPCKTITVGVAAVSAARPYLRLAAGTYSEQVIVDGKTVEVAGRGAELTTPLGQALELRNGAAVTIVGLEVSGAPGAGLACSNASATLHEVRLEDNVGRAIDASGCQLTVERSRLVGNRAGGLSATGGRATVRNSFIARNGNTDFGGVAVQLVNPTQLVLELNTIADNVIAGGNTGAHGLLCVAGVPVTVTGNIVVGVAANQVDADSCSPRYTLSNEAVGGEGNLVGQPTFRDPMNRDYHLMPGSAGIDAADPASTAAVDIDGEPRPHGGRSDIGADELQ